MTRFDDLDLGLAKHMLDRMGSTGQPPERGARLVNVATEELLEVMRREYLVPMKATGRNSIFKLVQAPFGGGKTHFLHCLREMSWEEGFVTALVGLSPKECPFDRPVSVYREVALRLEMPVAELDAESRQGIDVVLSRIAQLRAEESSVDAYLEWLRQDFSKANIESRAYGRAVRMFLEAVVTGDIEKEELLGDYLRGDSIETRELADLRLRERIDDSNAFRWLRSMVQSLSALGMPGVVLMFDEMDRNMSLGVRRRREIGDNLRQMIDYCGQSLLPGVVWCYAVPPEFMDTIVPEYPALAQRLKGASRFSELSPVQPIIDLDRLPLEPTRLLEEIGLRLLDLASRAHAWEFDQALQKQNIADLARELGERQFESGTRRQFVKAAVALLENQRRSEEHSVSAADIRTMAGGSAPTGPEPMPGEVEF